METLSKVGIDEKTDWPCIEMCERLGVDLANVSEILDILSEWRGKIIQ